jgi:2-dehydropantoate 2-reductase
MRLLVLGAGAIGGYTGGTLGLAGHEITFVIRPAAVARWQEQGLRLTVAGSGQTRVLRRFSSVTSLAEGLTGGPYDGLLFTIKSNDTAAAVGELRASTGAPPPIVCLQNGVDNEAVLAEAFGPERVIAGTVTSPVSKPAEAEVVVERERGLGLALEHPLSRELLTAFTTAGLKAVGYPAAGPMKWSKLISNLLGNATSAILDMSVDAIFADPRLYAVEAAMLRECLAVMRRLGYPVVDLPGMPLRALVSAVRLPAGAARRLVRMRAGAGRGAKKPSIYADLHAGRRTEVRWLNGAVVAHGDRLGVPAPVNRALTETVEALADGRLDPAAFRGRPEALLKLIGA